MKSSGPRTGRLHYELVRGLIDQGAVPTREELQSGLRCSVDELEAALEQLAREHGVVLHPGSPRVWVVHPFSTAPTPFLVESGDRKWWGNCAWCSLGIAVLVDQPCVLTTTLGAEAEQVQLEIRDGRIEPSDLVVHFPVPMEHAWDNVVYTCSTMLLFRDEHQVADWSERHRIARGDVQPVTKVLELAKRWYGGHLDPDWRKTSVEDARALFVELGLDHPVWSLPGSKGRF